MAVWVEPLPTPPEGWHWDTITRVPTPWNDVWVTAGEPLPVTWVLRERETGAVRSAFVLESTG